MAITEPRAPELAPQPHGHWLIQWLTTTDHKRIGILYLLNSFAFFFVAGVFALLMRSELAAPGRQLVTTNGYNQLFTLHGTLMIFLFILPVLVGFGNYLVPLQIGALDMAFPRINALSFWLLPVGGLTILSGLLAKGVPPRPGGPATRRSPSRAGRARTCGSWGWSWSAPRPS